MTISMRRSAVCVAVLLASSGSAALANPATMIFANTAHAGTSGKDAVPGMPGLTFSNFNKIYGSSGAYWVTAATVAGTGVAGATDQVVVIGNGSSVTAPAREGVTAVGPTGQFLNLSGLAVPRINGSGNWAIGFNPAGTNNSIIVRNVAGSYQTIAVAGNASPVPDYAYGPTFASTTIVDSDRVWFLSDGFAGSPRAAFADDGQSIVALELATTLPAPTPDGSGGLLKTISYSLTATTFHVSADGETTLYLADLDVGAGLRSVIFNNQVVLQVGQAAPDMPVGTTISAISECWLEVDQSWFARVTLSAGGVAVYRNRELIARVGAPITPGATETWSGITDFKGDLWGNFIVTGTTSAASTSNDVAVLNSSAVIAREGDPVDLNGDGEFNDSLFIHSFRDRCFMTNEYAFYVGARMKATAAGTSSLGANVSLIRIPFEICIADFNADGGVDGGDVEAFFLAWEASADAADVNLDGGIDGSDIESFFVRWEAGC